MICLGERKKTTQTAEQMNEIEIRMGVKVCCWWMKEERNKETKHIDCIQMTISHIALQIRVKCSSKVISLLSRQQMHSSTERKHLTIQTSIALETFTRYCLLRKATVICVSFFMTSMNKKGESIRQTGKMR